MPENSDNEIELSPRLEALAEDYANDPKSRKFLPLAEEYRKSGMHDEAIYFCREGLKNHPNFVRAKITLAKCLLDIKERDEAIAILEEVVESNPENAGARRSLADVYYSLGNSRRALPQYEALQNIVPDSTVRERIDELKRVVEGPAQAVDLSGGVEEAVEEESDAVEEVEDVETPSVGFAEEAPALETVEERGVEIDVRESLSLKGDVEEEQREEDELDLSLDEQYEDVELSIKGPTPDSVSLASDEPIAGAYEIDVKAVDEEGEIEAFEISAESEELEEEVPETEVDFGGADIEVAVEEELPSVEAEVPITTEERVVTEPEELQKRPVRFELEVRDFDDLDEHERLTLDSQELILERADIIEEGASPPEDDSVSLDAFDVETGVPADEIVAPIEFEEATEDVVMPEVQVEESERSELLEPPEPIEMEVEDELVIDVRDMEKGIELEPELIGEERPAEVSSVEPDMIVEKEMPVEEVIAETEVVEEMVEEFEVVEKEDTGYPATLTSAKILEEQGHFEKALTIYKDLYAQAPDDDFVASKIAELVQKLPPAVEELGEEIPSDVSPDYKMKKLKRWTKNIEAFRRKRDTGE